MRRLWFTLECQDLIRVLGSLGDHGINHPFCRHLLVGLWPHLGGVDREATDIHFHQQLCRSIVFFSLPLCIYATLISHFMNTLYIVCLWLKLGVLLYSLPVVFKRIMFQV